MIDAKELRIGNIINNRLDLPKHVIDFKEETYRYYLSNERIIKEHLKNATGIPLTADHLKYLGFIEQGCFDKGKDLTYFTFSFSEEAHTDLSLISSYIEEGNVIVELFPYSVFKFKYVHDVQNIISSVEKGLIKIN